MKKNILLAAMLLGIALPIRAQMDIGAGISPWDSSPFEEKKKKAKPVDPYVYLLSRRYDIKQYELTKLFNRGYGRNELIKVILISRKAGKPLREVVKKRDNGTRLSRMSEEYHLDYRQLLSDAVSVRRELDFEVAASSGTIGMEVSVSSETVSGSTATIHQDFEKSDSTFTENSHE